jgi:hypothetical protein
MATVKVVVARRPMLLDGQMVGPGQPLPDQFTNRTEQFIDLLVRNGFAEFVDAEQLEKTAKLDADLQAMDAESLVETCKLYGLATDGDADQLRQRLRKHLLG